MNSAPLYIKIIKGCAAELVCQRELRVEYQTNRNIKAWAIYFLLKSTTTSGVIKQWRRQPELLELCQCGANTLYTNIIRLKNLKLLSFGGGFNLNSERIELASYEDAAAILGIEYDGCIEIEYKQKNDAKQLFQQQLKCEDIRCNQERQMTAMYRKVNKNPLLKAMLDEALVQAGAEQSRLQQAKYFATRLLMLQVASFVEGSAILQFIHKYRADLNRGVRSMASAHCAISPSTISYMKKRLQELELITRNKPVVHSKVDSRPLMPDGSDAYKWVKKKKCTGLMLCDQLEVLQKFRPTIKKISPHAAKTAA